LCLGQRIQARVCVLVVFPPGEPGAKGHDAQLGMMATPSGRPVMNRIKSEIESVTSAGASVELFVVEGRYDQELIDAARQLKTTLLVASASSGDEQGGEREPDLLGRILNGVDCRVELVSPKKHQESQKDGT